MVTLQNLRVSFTTLDVSHLNIIRGWRNNPSVMAWTRQNDLINQLSHERWYKRQSFDPTCKMYLLVDDKQSPIGVCGLTSIDLINRRAEFSLYIEPGSQNLGYGKEALYLLCYHGFCSYPLHIIWGESFAGNPAINIFRKLGFKDEGVRRDFYFRNGKFVDANLFSIKRSELTWTQ